MTSPGAAAHVQLKSESSPQEPARHSGEGRLLAAGLALAASLCLPCGEGALCAAERPLTLEEAIERALRHNDDIIVQRESVAAADAAMLAARGAYDPVLEVAGGWRRSSPPINSSFSGAPAGALSPTTEGFEAEATVSQLLPWGGTVLGRTLASRETTDNEFTLLAPSYGTQVGVELRQPLLRNRATDAARLQIRIAAAQERLAGASLLQTLNEILAQVEGSYWTLVAVRSAVGVQEESVRWAEEQMEQTRIRIEMGVAPETEISQPRAELERRRGDLFAARESVSRAQNALKLLILEDPAEDRPAGRAEVESAAPAAGGSSGATPGSAPGSAAGPAVESLWSDELVPADPPEVAVQPVNVETSLREALGRRPEVAAARAAVERREAQAVFARDAVKPALDAVVSYDRLGLAGDLNDAESIVPGLNDPAADLEGGFPESVEFIRSGDFEDTRAQLVFRIPVGNRAAKGAAAEALSAQRQAEAELIRARKIVRADVLDAASALQTAGQRIEAASAAREAAQVQLSAEQDRYANGLSTNFLVLTRQNDLSRARLEEIAAVTDYLRARAQMGRATGTLLDDRRISVMEEGREH